MQLRTATGALIVSVLYFATGAAAVSCAVCAPSITFQGAVRTLTLNRQESGNTVQCNYDTPAIPGFSPGCLYQNVNGVLIFTNAGTACPSPLTLVQKTSC